MVDIILDLILSELKQGLSKLYADRLQNVYAFGSYTRGEQEQESDLDILIVLDTYDQYSDEIKRTSELVSKLSLKYGVSISRKFVNQAQWVHGDTSLLRHVRIEAIVA